MMYNTEGRLPYLRPEALTPEQKAFYDANVQAMQPMPYVWLTPDKELNGPTNVMLYEVEIGNMLFPLNRTMIKTSIDRVGGAAHEIAILVTVSSVKAHYGMYAHTQLARKFGVSDDQIAAVMNGQKPAGLGAKEAAAYDLAWALCQTGAIPGSVYDHCVAALGQDGFNALVLAIGMFKLIGTILNAYNEPVPEYR